MNREQIRQKMQQNKTPFQHGGAWAFYNTVQEQWLCLLPDEDPDGEDFPIVATKEITDELLDGMEKIAPLEEWGASRYATTISFGRESFIATYNDGTWASFGYDNGPVVPQTELAPHVWGFWFFCNKEHRLRSWFFSEGAYMTADGLIAADAI